jgi:serine/threonine protein kinase
VKLAAKSFLKEDIQKSTKLKDSVLSEALMLRRLKHPNIINLVEVHEDATALYFIYPLYNGGDLFEKFR